MSQNKNADRKHCARPLGVNCCVRPLRAGLQLVFRALPVHATRARNLVARVQETEGDDGTMSSVCPICFVEFPGIAVPQCGHAFCGACLTEWKLHNTTCPLCRGPLDPEPLEEFAYTGRVRVVRFDRSFRRRTRAAAMAARSVNAVWTLRITGATLELCLHGVCFLRRSCATVENMSSDGSVTTLKVTGRRRGMASVAWGTNDGVSHAIKAWFVRAASSLYI